MIGWRKWTRGKQRERGERERENCSICSFVTFALCRTDKRNYTVRPEWYIPLHFHTRHTFSPFQPLNSYHYHIPPYRRRSLRRVSLSLSLSFYLSRPRLLCIFRALYAQNAADSQFSYNSIIPGILLYTRIFMHTHIYPFCHQVYLILFRVFSFCFARETNAAGRFSFSEIPFRF